MAAPYANPLKVCGPVTSQPAAIDFTPQDGLTDGTGHPPGGAMAPEPPIVCQPRLQTDVWRPRVRKPSDLLPAQPARIPFEPQANGSPDMRRPKQALRELALPSARPWRSLTTPWQSFLGFHFVLPRVQEVVQVVLRAPDLLPLWKAASEMRLGGRRFLPEWQEILWGHNPSTEGARIKRPALEPAAAATPFCPGLNAAIRGNRLSLEDPGLFAKSVSAVFPLSEPAIPPAPTVALSAGLEIWTRTINSYMPRNLCPPRLHESGRAVHMLRLAPSTKANQECKISAA